MRGTQRLHFLRHLCVVLWSARRQLDAAQPGHAEEPLLRPAWWPEGAPSRATGTADSAPSADPHERPGFGKPRGKHPRQQQYANEEPPARRGPDCVLYGRRHWDIQTGGGLGGRCRAVGGPARLQQLLWWLLKGEAGGEVLPHQLHWKWLQDASVQDLLPGTRTCKSTTHFQVHTWRLTLINVYKTSSWSSSCSQPVFFFPESTAPSKR